MLSNDMMRRVAEANPRKHTKFPLKALKRHPVSSDCHKTFVDEKLP